ncbi:MULTISPECIES: IS4 family transposase [Bacillus]|uniref:IS4 family transposase n=1 Tax=Bacillus TaxID=1386 RepID=UPI0002FA1C7B|nr:IS4 family transposase [Bacillus pseudomycoides]MED1597870.1 IS4 family transposase [Bacillus pseudomycoides]MED4710976.1 IS4 family transposase [Bacillus pseudomycoides]OOR51572.1 IS4 family transposase [Bacillus pseudomycoides]PDY08767.1 IS4 family transposase [Bacillus pseudomycoides]PEU33640.1 IS4 family transposase [Bacillus pseudomycoides]
MNLSISDELELFSKELQRYMSPHALEKFAREIGFVQRKSKYRAQDLVALCVWLSENIANTSLTQLSSRLEANTGISMSPEGLNQRFNSRAVQFLQQILASLLHQQFCSSSKIPTLYTNYFRRIRVLDSTHFQIPDKFTSTYQGSGGSGQSAGVKIQLEYDLLSGQFLHVHVGAGKHNDKTYGSTCLKSLQPQDVCIRDLGYFDLNDLHTIDEHGAYFISRLKLNTRIYQKNKDPEYFQNGTIKKHSEYIQLDMEQFIDQLQSGETYEIPEIYIGMYQKLPARLILYKLTETQMKRRQKDLALKEHKKQITYKERSKRLSAIHFYITNISPEHLPKEQVYDFYSLRWQIELIFKTWKSFFRIHHCNSVKLERLECHLYGQLISILLCSSTMFQMRQLLLIKKKRELSEYKAIYIIKDYFSLIYQPLQEDTQELIKILFRLFNLLQKNGRKSHRYEKKTVFDILSVVYNFSMSHNHVA